MSKTQNFVTTFPHTSCLFLCTFDAWHESPSWFRFVGKTFFEDLNDFGKRNTLDLPRTRSQVAWCRVTGLTNAWHHLVRAIDTLRVTSEAVRHLSETRAFWELQDLQIEEQEVFEWPVTPPSKNYGPTKSPLQTPHQTMTRGLSKSFKVKKSESCLDQQVQLFTSQDGNAPHR